MPKGFGLAAAHGHSHVSEKHVVHSTLARVDISGTILLLFAVLSLTAGFEEADSEYPWKSAYVIALLTISGCLWAVLLVWERYVTRANSIREPVLPWRFFQNRVMVGVLL